MPDTKPFSDGHPGVDPDRLAPKNAFDHDGGYSGQDYDIERERAMGSDMPAGEVDPRRASPGEPEDRRDIPPEAGKRASFDPRTGEVHGSGTGAGGGSGGEEFED